MKFTYLVFAASVLASTVAKAELREVPDREFNNYKMAVLDAFDVNLFACDLNEPTSVLSNSSQAFVDDSGPQPSVVLIFQRTPESRISARITSDQSYKKIIRIDFYPEVLTGVNHGTLVKPIIRKEWKANKKAYSCVTIPTSQR